MKFHLTLLCLAALAFVGCSGCSTTGPNPATNERNAGINAAGSAALADAGTILGQALTSSLFGLAQSEMGGSQAKVNLGQSAANAVWAQVNSQTIGADIHDAVSAFSAGKLRQTAIEAEKAADAALANGKTPDQVSNAVATVISTAAGAPPAK